MTVKDVIIKPKVVEPVFTPFDPWNPVLKNSPSLHVTPEQDVYIKEILEICCSDSAFAKKAYVALQHILTGASAVPPSVTSVSPATSVVDLPVSLTVTGTGFTSTSVIQFGGPVVTVFVSETSLTAEVTAPAAEGVVPVTVDVDGTIVGPVDFTVTPIVLLSAPSDKKDLGPELKKEYEIKDKKESK